jgi:hypothetical protein
MKRFTWKHAAAGLALLAVLSLVAPAPAQAAGWGFGEPVAWSGGAWAWIASLWDQFAALVRGAPGASGAAGGPGGHRHAAAKSDPASSGSATGGASSAGDASSMINPDGSPAIP